MILEEVIDIIFFCSFIVYDLVYKAVIIVIEREKENFKLLEGLRFIVIISEKYNFYRNDFFGRISKF